MHLTLGLGGWFGLMVVGVFYRLVPLIHGARVASAQRGAAILLLSLIAISGVVGGIAVGVSWMLRVSAWLSTVALALFSPEVIHVMAHRRNRVPDVNAAHWYAVVVYSVALAAILSSTLCCTACA